jgi:hypothetical protein
MDDWGNSSRNFAGDFAATFRKSFPHETKDRTKYNKALTLSTIRVHSNQS